MGPYDNDKGEHFEIPEVMDAHWMVHDETGALYIIAREDDGFEGYGEDDDILEELFELDDAELEDEDLMTEKGFTLVYQPLRRFEPQTGYYTA